MDMYTCTKARHRVRSQFAAREHVPDGSAVVGAHASTCTACESSVNPAEHHLSRVPLGLTASLSQVRTDAHSICRVLLVFTMCNVKTTLITNGLDIDCGSGFPPGKGIPKLNVAFILSCWVAPCMLCHPNAQSHDVAQLM
jgi:hypothetical protein